MKYRKIIMSLLLSFFFLATTKVHADMNAYRMYNPNSGLHFWTSSEGEKASLVQIGWHYEGIGWGSVDKSATPVYRLYNPHSGEHFYTTNAHEKEMLVQLGWHYEGVPFYSGGKTPIYRLSAKTHMYTSSLAEKESLVKSGWRYEGIAWYSISASYSQSVDKIYTSYSGQANDIHYPQFYYFNASKGLVATYQGNNIYFAYNDAVFNFNTQLEKDAANADYANWQARLNWTNTQNANKLAVDNAKAALDTATNQMKQAQDLVAQDQKYLDYDKQYNLDQTKDQANLAKDQTALNAAVTTKNTANTNYQNKVNAMNAFNAKGTDYVQLRYTLSYSDGQKIVHVNFTKTTRTNGVISESKFTRQATLYVDK